DTINGSITGSQSITVNPAAAYKLAIARFPYKPTAGVPGSFRVTIQDRYSNTINMAPYFTDTVAFSSSDPLAVLPGKYTFTGADAGVHSFAATLNSLGGQSISATDTANASIMGSESMIVVFLTQPTVTVSGPFMDAPGHFLAVPGQPLNFKLDASEFGVPAGTRYMYSVQWGDGSPTESILSPMGSSAAQALHTYVAPAPYSITVTATDQMFFNTNQLSIPISITPVAMETDPSDQNLTALYVGCTTSTDTIA